MEINRYIPWGVSLAGLIGFEVWHSWLFIVVLLGGLIAPAIRAGRGLARKLSVPAAPPSPEQAQLQAIRRALSRAQFQAGTEALGERAFAQLTQLGERKRAFDRILGAKFDPAELTYARYRDAVAEVHSRLLGQLMDLGQQLELLGSVQSDPGIRPRAEKMLAENDQALGQLDKLSGALAEVRSLAQGGGTELAPLLAQLEELAQRAKKY